MPYNSTIRVKKRRCSSCGQVAYIFSKGRCEQCARIENHAALVANDSPEDFESVAILKKDADILFSRVVRLRGTDVNGFCECFICGNRDHYTKMQLGHFTNREDSTVRFHPKNCRINCVNCNIHLKGNLVKYAEKLDAEEKRLSEWLYLEGNQVYKFDREELKQMIVDYSREIRILMSKLK